MSGTVRFNREFAMPDEATFSIRPISELLDRWLPSGTTLIVDPFARDSTRGTMTNDLNPRTRAAMHIPAEEFLANFEKKEFANVALFDPPYSPRQIAECYKIAKRKAEMIDTQNARLCKVVKDGLDKVLRPGGIAICCGWNSMGFGIGRGYEMLEILLVNHGAAHNDTIVTVERKLGGDTTEPR